jgi:regulatory protein
MKERLPRRLDAGGLLQYALRALGARAHSAGELREKLARRAERASDVQAVITRLKESGYLDDRKYDESFSAARLENDGLGRARVLRELRVRRVAPGVAEKAVTAAYLGSDEVALIEDYLRRKYRGRPLEEWLADPKNLRSAYGRLRRAGFSAANSIRVLKRFSAAPETLEAIESEEEPPEGEP